MKNQEIAQLLYEIADILEIQEVPFKPQAYRNAARSIENLSEDIAAIHQRGELDQIPGVGEHIGKKIIELLKTGKLEYYTKLKKEIGFDVEQLLKVPTLGPKRIKILHKELKINSVSDLEKAIKSGKLRKLPGFGTESEKHLLEGINLIKTTPQRYMYASAIPIVKEIIAYFKKQPFVKKIEVAGSFRRGKETIGDLDFLVISTQPEKVIKLFIKYPEVKEVLAKGTTKGSVRLRNGMQVDLRVVKEKEFGSAMNYFIGNKEHNIALRKFALSKGYTLSEYGLFKLKGKKWVAGRTESEIYDKLKMDYIEPELRENTGEIEASQKHQLPKLITPKDIRGLFHNHSTWSDGENSLLEMAQQAEKMGFQFISFNEHYSNIGIVNPLNEKRLSGYLKEIEKVRKKVKIKVFSGIEIDIQKDGTLNLSLSKLKQFNIVIAALHSSLQLPEKEMTERVCKALKNYPIHILAHPLCGQFGKRPPIQLNLEKVFAVCKRKNIFLEINSSPQRMDLNGINVKAALKAGCKLVLSTDAHDVHQLETYPLGVLCARRGWLEKKDVMNCWEMKKIEKELKKINYK
ncbi:MAG: DNA polymerase/3'-5' exonuclease PolX [Candidatus Woesearchaeota archaeon]